MDKKNIAKLAFRFVFLVGVVNLFADMTYEGARSINGAFLASLGASAIIVSVVSGLGEFLGYSAMGISHFEQGKRDLKISDLKKISDHFKKPLSFFLVSEQVLYRANKKEGNNADFHFSLKKFDDFLDKQGL